MKNLHKTILLFAVTAGLVLGGCKKWIEDDYNIDPNKPAEVSLPLMLSAAEGGWGFLHGSDISRFASLFTQHHAGVDRQHAGFDIYLLNESDVNNSWNSTYSSVLGEIQTLIATAESKGSPHYAGVGKVLSSMIIMTTTDLYGDIPYSDAFQGADKFQPGYDSQEKIYTRIIADLDAAIGNLNAATSVISPGADDLIYGGSRTKWVKLANALKARAHVHLGLKSSARYGQALAAIDAGALASNADDANFNFFGTASSANPWFSFIQDRGDIMMSKFFVDMLNGLNDPRLPFYAGKNANGGYSGSPNGSPDLTASPLGAFYASASSPVVFMSFAEQKFIEAEAAMQSGDPIRAASAYNAAVIASLNKVTGTADAAYVAANASETAVTINMNKIMTQKYITMYTSVESFTDVRRTGIPALAPVSGTQFPVRFPYAQSERLYNQSNFPGQKGLFEKVWWDN